MDNRINKIRRKISALRAEIGALEAAVRDQINRNVDCSENALRQLALRCELLGLIGEWKSAGGGDRLPGLQEHLKENHRARDKAEKLPRTRLHLR
jgi:hypothetical protein